MSTGRWPNEHLAAQRRGRRQPTATPRRPRQRLDVYLEDRKLGELERQGPTRYRFRYADEAVERHGDGTLLLSASLPLRAAAFPNGETKPFFEGLLPEGATRAAIARSFGLSEDNGFGLLAELGSDCAGAVVILPAGTPPPSAGSGSIDWLTDDQLVQRIEDLPRNPLGITDAEGRVRLSLAGVQPKLVVTRSPSGRIGQPTGGAPSTHLLKPAQERYPDLVANEAFCLRVARSVGLRAANAKIVTFGDRECLLVERWDRTIDGDGRITRLHQEDFCQALGRLPSAKYEVEGGPSFAEMIALLRSMGAPTLARDVLELLRALVLNFVLGNADAHGKNYALLYETLGVPGLAPLYDIVSTSVYADVNPRLAMRIGAVDDADAVDLAAWSSLAVESGLGAQVTRTASAFAARVVASARALRELSRAEGWHRPVLDGIVALAERRAARLGL
ncbi:MAG: type II toxin-antitoxin system HipA family toxin [Gaiella sp.]|nr:type II toxin-antitoxin system HipA family toxin [Gaiella sp.]